MELAEILQLVKAGYTKDEIAQLQALPTPTPNPEPVPVDTGAQDPEPGPAPAPVVQPVAVPAPASAPAPAPVQQVVPAPVQDQTTLADIMQGIAKLTSAVQANAIAQSVIPGGANQGPTAEDMLAEIIRPKMKEVK